MNAGGKYDAECAANCHLLEARGLVMIVVDGKRGSGFSVSAHQDYMLDFDAKLPELLRELAADIEQQQRMRRGDA